MGFAFEKSGATRGAPGGTEGAVETVVIGAGLPGSPTEGEAGAGIGRFDPLLGVVDPEARAVDDQATGDEVAEFGTGAEGDETPEAGATHKGALGRDWPDFALEPGNEECAQKLEIRLGVLPVVAAAIGGGDEDKGDGRNGTLGA